MDPISDVSEHPNKPNHRLVTVDLIVPFDGPVQTLCNNDMSEYDDRIVRLSFTLPDSFFKPALVKINPPEELVQTIVGEMEQVEIPVVLDHDREAIAKVMVSHNLSKEITKQKDGVFLGLLKRVVTYLEKSDDKRQ